MRNFENSLQKIEFAAQQGMSFNSVCEQFSCSVQKGEEFDAFHYTGSNGLSHAFVVLFAKLARTLLEKAQYAEESSTKNLCEELGRNLCFIGSEFRREFCDFVAGYANQLPVHACSLLVLTLGDRNFAENMATSSVRCATVAFCHEFIDQTTLKQTIQQAVFSCHNLVQFADDVNQACGFVTSTQIHPSIYETLKLVCGEVLYSISICREHRENGYAGMVVDKMFSVLTSCVKTGVFSEDEAMSLHNMFALFCDTWSVMSTKRASSAATIALIWRQDG